MADDQIYAGHGKHKRDPLFQRKGTSQRIRRIVLAQKLDRQPHAPVQQRIEPDDLAVAMRPRQLPHKDQADDPFRECFVELRWMQRNPEWHAGRCVRVGEGDSPGQMRRFAPAAARREAAEAAYPMSDRKPWRKQSTSQGRVDSARAYRKPQKQRPV